MLKRFLLVITVFTIGVTMIFAPRTRVGAQDTSVQNIQKYNLFKAGEHVVVTNQDIDGDVVLFGQSIKLENVHINGNLFVTSESIETSNVEVKGSVFAVGNRIILDLAGAKNLYVGGNVIDISIADAGLGAYLVGNSLRFNGDLYGDLFVSGSSIYVAGTVGGKAHIVTSEGGHYNAENLQAVEGVKVTVGKASLKSTTTQKTFLEEVTSTVRWSIGALFLGWALVYIFGQKKIKHVFTYTKGKKKLLSDALVALLGIATFMFVPLLLVLIGGLLKVTLHWAGLGLFLIGVGMLLLVPGLAVINAGFWLQELLGDVKIFTLGKIKNFGVYELVALASVVLGVVSLIPGLGALAYGFLYLTTLGEMIRYMWAHWQK